MATYEAAIADVDRNLRAASIRLDRYEADGNFERAAACQAIVDKLLDDRADLARASAKP